MSVVEKCGSRVDSLVVAVIEGLVKETEQRCLLIQPLIEVCDCCFVSLDKELGRLRNITVSNLTRNVASMSSTETSTN